MRVVDRVLAVAAEDQTHPAAAKLFGQVDQLTLARGHAASENGERGLGRPHFGERLVQAQLTGAEPKPARCAPPAGCCLVSGVT